MTMQVSRVMDELHEDHRNLTVLLNVLEREIGRIEAAQESDLELLHDIMAYMTGYPDAVHHRKEDWVYARMAAGHSNLQGDLERIEADHAEIGRFGSRLLDDIREIEAGAFKKRADVLEDARRYLERQRNHMRWEDTHMFPMIDSVRDELDLGAPPASVADMPDPVFGADVERDFRMLYDAIRREARH